MVAFNFLEALRSKRLSNVHFVEKLIRLYRANECLWNPKSPGYRNLSLKENAWQRISQFFNDELTVDQLKLTIASLRHFYERERLREHFNEPRETYYQKLQFLENVELENDNVKAIEAQTNLCNSQINCIVEDTFLIGNSQNSIHSEHVDFGLPFTLSEDYSCKLALSEKMKKSSLNLPHPPIEFQAKGLQIRALSGNDRSYSKSNYNGNVEHDEFRHRPSRSHSMQPKTQRPNSNNTNVINQNYDYCTKPPCVSNGDVPINQFDDWAGPHTSSQPRRKVLTGKYSKRTSRQKFTDNTYENKLNEIQQNSNPIVFRDICRTTSGNDQAYQNNNFENNNYPNSQLAGQGRNHCICCPQKCQNKNQNPYTKYYESEQVDNQNRNINRDNRSQIPPQTEYVDTDRTDQNINFYCGRIPPESEYMNTDRNINIACSNRIQMPPQAEYMDSDHTDQSKNSKRGNRSQIPDQNRSSNRSNRSQIPDQNRRSNRSNRSQIPDQNRSNNRSNRIQMPPYEPLEPNDDEFQTPEPTSEENAPQVAPRQKPRPVPYEWQQRKEKPYEDYDARYSEISEQSAQSGQPDRRPPKKDHQVRCRGLCADNSNNQACRNDPQRHASESISECSLDRDHEPESARQSGRSGSKPTSRAASQVASRNRSNQGSVAQSAYESKQGLMPDLTSPDQEVANRRVYCSRNLNQVDEVHRDKYVECPSKKRQQRRRNEEELIEDPDLRGRCRARRENSNARTFRDEDEENPNQRFSNRSSRQRENSRSNSDRYDREDTSSERRQQRNDPNEEYSPLNNDQYSSYDNDQNPKHSVIRSKMPEKYTARNTTTAYVYEGSGSDNSYKSQNKDSEKPRNYEKNQTKFEEEEDSCFCSSDEFEPITRPGYADQVEEYPYADDTREEYPQGYAVEPRDKYSHGFAEEALGKYSITCSKETCNECPHEYGKDTEEEAPVEYVQQISKDSRKNRKQGEYSNCCTEETCDAYGHARVDAIDTREEYSKGHTRDEYPKGRPRSTCEKCCDEIQNDFSGDSGDDEQSQVYLGAKETREDENVDKTGPCYCEVAVETEIDMTLNDRNKANNKDGNTNQSKSIKATKKPKLSCKCVPKGMNKATAGRSANPGPKNEIAKQRSASPSGGVKSRMAPMKRHNKLEDDMENQFQAYDGQLEPRFYRAPEEPRPYNRNLNRQSSGVERGPSRAPYPQSYPIGGMSVLGTFQVPPTLAEKTINIVKKHISNMTPLAINDFSREPNKSRQVQAKSVSKESPQRKSTRPRSVSCTGPSRKPSNPFLNINFDVSKGQIIILHPPVQNFRPSKYSFNQNAVEGNANGSKEAKPKLTS